MTTGLRDIDCLEKRGVDAGPNGDDETQLSLGSRETEGPGEVDGRGACGEYALGMCGGGEAALCVKDVERRLCPNGGWVGGGGDGSSLVGRRKRLRVGIVLVLFAWIVRGLEALSA